MLQLESVSDKREQHLGMMATMEEKAAPTFQRVSRREITKTTLNWPLLLGTVVVLGVLAVVTYVRYASQQDRSLAAFLERASQLEAEEEWLESANYLYRYLRLRPSDASVWNELACTYAKGASSFPQWRRAIEFHHRALAVVDRFGAEPARETRDKLSTQLAELLVKTNAFKEAERLADQELVKDKNNWPYMRIKAISLYWQSRTSDLRSKQLAYDALRDAWNRKPSDWELATYAARIYRSELTQIFEQQRKEEADYIMDRMIHEEASKENAAAYLARYQYRFSFRLPGAEEDLQKALEFGADRFDIVITSGNHAIRQAQLPAVREGTEDSAEQLNRAAQFFERAIQLRPEMPQGYIGLGQARLIQGNPAEACTVWERGIQNVNGNRVVLYRRLADALIRQEKYAEANDVIQDHLVPAIERTIERGSFSSKARSLLLGGVGLLEAKLLLARNDPVNTDGERGESESNSVLVSDSDRISDTELAVTKLKSWIKIYEGMAATQQQVAVTVQMLELLARAQLQLGELHEAATTYDRICQFVPKSGFYLRLAAGAWRRAGDSRRALRLYETLAAQPNVPPTIWLSLAELRLQEQVKLPRERRNWNKYDVAFRKATEASSRSWKLQLLAARQVIGSRGPSGDAVAAEYLAAAEAMAPDDPTLWLRLVVLYEGLGRSADADRALSRHAKIAGNPGSHKLLRSRLLRMRGEHDEALRLVEGATSSAEEVSPQQRAEFLWDTVRSHMSAENYDAAKNTLDQLHELRPYDIRVMCSLAELALRAKDNEQIERWEMELRTVEGEGGIWWRYVCVRRHLQAASSSAPLSDEVPRLQKEIQASRPNWHFGYVLEGDILIRQKRMDEATEAYKRAVDLGATGFSVFERLIRLLYQAGNTVEADAYVTRLKNMTRSSDRNSAVSNATSVSLATELDQLPEALRRAQEWIDEQPEDPTARIWLGHVLALSGKDKESEQALMEATRLARDDVRTWNALFSFYLGRDEEAARKTLASLAEESKLTEDQRAMVLARGHELLKDTELAVKLYRQVIRLDSKNERARLRLAALLAGSDVESAQKELRDLLALNPESRPARQMLAALRVAQGGEDAWHDVEDLLGPVEDDGTQTAPERRWQAQLLSRYGGKENRERARQVLESLVLKNERPAPVDRLLLARIYEAEGNIDAAREQYLELANVSNARPGHVANLIGFLLRQQDMTESGRRLRQLDRATSDASFGQRLLFIALKSRWLHAMDRSAAIGPLVEPYAAANVGSIANVQKKSQFLARIAGIYASLKMYAEAEPWLRELVAVAPQTYPSLAAALCYLGRHDEALRLCLGNRPVSLSRQYVTNLVTVLSVNNPPEESFRKAEQLLREVVTQFNDDADTLFMVASVYVIQERFEEALVIYAKANERRPKHVLTMNNIATLLAEIPGQEQRAMSLIEQAIAIAGERPFLLDTKGVILLKRGDVLQAVEVLKQAVALPSTDPRFYFHLAVAYERNDGIDDAQSALGNALSHGLESSILTKSDKQQLHELRQRLGA